MNKRSEDLFSVNMEQTKRIAEMEKQLEFWKDKVSWIIKNVLTNYLLFVVLRFETVAQHLAVGRLRQVFGAIQKDPGDLNRVVKQNSGTQER